MHEGGAPTSDGHHTRIRHIHALAEVQVGEVRAVRRDGERAGRANPAARRRCGWSAVRVQCGRVSGFSLNGFSVNGSSVNVSNVMSLFSVKVGRYAEYEFSPVGEVQCAFRVKSVTCSVNIRPHIFRVHVSLN